MKKDSFLDFRDEIHSNKDLFEVPDFPDVEFELMLTKARDASKSNIVLWDRGGLFIKKLMISPRLAAALIFTIFALTIVSYVSKADYKKLDEKNTTVKHIDKNTRIPMDNIIQASTGDI